MKDNKKTGLLCKPKMLGCLSCERNCNNEGYCMDKGDCSVPYAIVDIENNAILAWAEKETKEDVPVDTPLTQFESLLTEFLIGSFSNEPHETEEAWEREWRKYSAIARKWSLDLLKMAKKVFQPEFDEELARAYQNQDEVVYKRGYEAGLEEGMKRRLKHISVIKMAKNFEENTTNNSASLSEIYRQGIVDTLESLGN